MSVDPATKYVIGDLVKLTARFADPVTGAALQPSSVTCEVMDPNGQLTHPTPTLDPTLSTPDGVTGPGYFTQVDVETAGMWYYRFAATGTGQAAQEGQFYVERSKFT